MPDEQVDVYDILNRQWQREDVNCAITVTRDQRLLLRRVGVETCIDFIQRLDEVEKQLGTNSRLFSRTISASYLELSAKSPLRSFQSPQKRKRANDHVEERDTPCKHARLGSPLAPTTALASTTSSISSLASESPFPSDRLFDPSISFVSDLSTSNMSTLAATSYTGDNLAYTVQRSGTPLNETTNADSSSSSSLVQPSPTQVSLAQSSLVQSPLAQSPSLAAFNSTGLESATPLEDAHDQEWKLGQVYVPSDCVIWPHGMYTQDMAKGFSFMAKLKQDSKKLSAEERFSQVFPGVKFVPATYGKQSKAWKDTPALKKDAALHLPRTVDGLWTTWRKTSSGWMNRTR